MDQINLTEAFYGKRVGILGDIMLDSYIVGRVDRVSPEAPVPVLLHERTVNRLGGAANVALNIKMLGSHPIVCSIVGDDKAGNELVDLMSTLGHSKHYIIQTKNRQTTVKTRLMGNNQQLLRLDMESSDALSPSEVDGLINRFNEMVNEEALDILILQDYNKGVLTKELIENVVSICKDKNIFIAVDPKFENFFAYRNVNLFKPNLKEISQAFNRDVAPELDDLDRVKDDLENSINPEYCMITLSDRGVYLSKSNADSIIVPAEKDEIVDVCGAGDAVLAVSALMLYAGLGEEVTGVVANKAGKIVCQKIGVAPVSINELINDV